MIGQVGKIETLTSGEVKISVYVQKEQIPADLMGYNLQMVKIVKAGETEQEQEKDKFYEGMKKVLAVVQDLIDDELRRLTQEGGEDQEVPF